MSRGRCPRARRRHRRTPARTRGAALIVAMLVLATVATAAAAMVWQQQRAVQIEAAERARLQAALVLDGTLDFVRLILRPLGGKPYPGLNAIHRLEESRLGAFLAGDGGSAEGTPDVFLSGELVDAQSRYNLRRLFGDGNKPVPAEVDGLKRLCAAAGAADGVAEQLVSALGQAWFGRSEQAALAPLRVSQLGWIGIDADTRARLAPFVTILPTRTPLNANTAAPAALLAAMQVSPADAQRIATELARRPAASVADLQALLPPGSEPLETTRVDVTTNHFEVTARVRDGDRVLETLWLLRRGQNGALEELRRERSSRVRSAR